MTLPELSPLCMSVIDSEKSTSAAMHSTILLPVRQGLGIFPCTAGSHIHARARCKSSTQTHLLNNAPLPLVDSQQGGHRLLAVQHAHPAREGSFLAFFFSFSFFFVARLPSSSAGGCHQVQRPPRKHPRVLALGGPRREHARVVGVHSLDVRVQLEQGGDDLHGGDAAFPDSLDPARGDLLDALALLRAALVLGVVEVGDLRTLFCFLTFLRESKKLRVTS